MKVMTQYIGHILLWEFDPVLFSGDWLILNQLFLSG